MLKSRKRDKYDCKNCFKSTMGEDGFCQNCGHCSKLDADYAFYDYEDEYSANHVASLVAPESAEELDSEYDDE